MGIPKEITKKDFVDKYIELSQEFLTAIDV